jgi:predicted nucleotidyltransferase
MISRRTIDEISSRIVERFHPDKIILFGSYARGEATEMSDIDLLVISETSLPRPKRSAPIYSLLRDYPVSKDILVYTPEEAEQYRDLPAATIRRALLEGIVLYERQA